MDIQFVKKEDLYPAFGMAWPDQRVVWVREDLPASVRAFVECHERYHLRDKAKWWVWREIKANCYAALCHPWGFVVCAVMSLAPYRLKYYWQRIWEGR